MLSNRVVARAARLQKLLLILVSAFVAAWTMLAVADGTAAAAPSGSDSSQSGTHDTTKPKPTTTTKPAAPAKTTKSSKAPTAATPVSAVVTASTTVAPKKPTTPSTPLPDAATVAALGTEVQRKSSVAAQLSPGYVVNSVVNTVGAALAGTAAHFGPGPAYDVRQVTQFVRQMVGIGFDFTAMGASLVNNIALLGAQTVGRNTLLGLPYNALNLVATVAGDVSKIITNTPLNAKSSGPYAVNYGVYNLLGYLNPQASPPGANVSSIKVTEAHPLPIILVNATAANQNFDWSVGAPALANAGYKVYTYNYGNITGNPNFPLQSTGDIAASAAQLSAEVDKVLAATGASKVILIGHSQGGGITPEYYLNNLGGAAKVSQFIGIAPSNHGTNVNGLTSLLAIPILGSLLSGLVNTAGPAWLQQSVGSSMVKSVYGNGDTRTGVIYDTIATTNDWVVTPYTQSALHGPAGTNITNVVVQQQDPGFAGGHLDVAISYQVWQDILGMLAANPAANPAPVAAVA